MEEFHKALMLQPESGSVLYNAACALSLLNRPDEALDYLERAVAADKQHRAMAKEDKDFALLRTHPEFGPRFASLVSG